MATNKIELDFVVETQFILRSQSQIHTHARDNSADIGTSQLNVTRR